MTTITYVTLINGQFGFIIEPSKGISIKEILSLRICIKFVLKA